MIPLIDCFPFFTAGFKETTSLQEKARYILEEANFPGDGLRKKLFQDKTGNRILKRMVRTLNLLKNAREAGGFSYFVAS